MIKKSTHKNHRSLFSYIEYQINIFLILVIYAEHMISDTSNGEDYKVLF